MNPTLQDALILAGVIVGSGGVTTIITFRVTRRKIKAEAHLAEAQAIKVTAETNKAQAETTHLEDERVAAGTQVLRDIARDLKGHIEHYRSLLDATERRYEEQIARGEATEKELASARAEIKEQRKAMAALKRRITQLEDELTRHGIAIPDHE